MQEAVLLRDYFITFLEGLMSFISPCLLPMIPIYVSYLAGDTASDGQKKQTFRNAVGFVLGFTLMFLLLGVFAGFFGQLLTRYKTVLNFVCGLIVVGFGLSYLGVFRLSFLKGIRGGHNFKNGGFFSSFLFGFVFSVSWTPCVGAFLGSALMLASHRASAVQGFLLLLCYSVGLGIPFLLSAVLVQELKSAFDWVKRHYKVINAVSGAFLILVGILMMTGTLGYWLGLLS